ncbi:helicase associated domain-containing protein [Paeniglutamicibacter antarcticus]|uniref:Helicase associated domain-containing protein n=1 Tax=Arthrobacter terrae TaxID=2935737 RepID=A0A931G3K4_9MICC|nr:helicase associated domain-containing protein [Arthrobacter terrae]MBG0738761.1 helicase associated domain-containing protein [Arthrobacter terrae]
MAAARRRPAAQALEMLDAFQHEHRRLPKATATDPAEKYLANFLFVTLRRRERRGTLPPAIRERAALIPGALTLDTHPDQDKVLTELAAFVQVHGHAPRYSRRGVPDHEVRLRAWISNNVYCDPSRKSPRLRVRHEEIQSILAGIPSFAEKKFDDRIALAEQFVRDHGYRPSGKAWSWLQAYIQGTYPIQGPFHAGSRLNDIRAARLRAVISSPNPVDFRWQRNFEDLTMYATAHNGELPSSWDEDLFSWLTVQRREYRHGRLTPEREAVLRTLPGILSEGTELAAAA